MKYRRRLERLERGREELVVLTVPTKTTESEKEAFVRDHLRENGLPPDTLVVLISRLVADL